MALKIDSNTFKSNMLVEEKGTGNLYKLGDMYGNMFTAQLVFPVPARTTVHQFSWEDGATKFLNPAKQLLADYDAAYRAPFRGGRGP